MLVRIVAGGDSEALCFWEQEGGIWLSYSIDNNLLSLAVDAEGQMAIFVTKTLSVCSVLVVLTYWTLGQRVLLLSTER